MRTLFDLGCTTRDGVRLSTDVYLPDDRSPAPVILSRTPYDNTREAGWGRYFAAQGYAFAAQDVRGRGDSDGTFTPWVGEFDDGYDAIEWAALQSWSNGRVGMLGGSYLAWVQWTAASRTPPHLVTMVTAGSPGRWFRDWPYRYGALWAEDYLEWLNRTSGRSYQPMEIADWAPLRESWDLRRFDEMLGRPMPHWQLALDHSSYDDYWRRLDVSGYEEMDYPVLHVTGWYDACAPGEFHHFREMVAKSPARDRQTLLVGAWQHHGACLDGSPVPGELEVGPDAALDLPAVWLRWFDRWLMQRPASANEWPAVRYYAMGANEWRDAGEWPPADTKQTAWYLHAGGGISPDANPNERSLAFRYDPADPTPSFPFVGSTVHPEWAAIDMRFLGDRGDVLRYRTDPFSQPLDLAGPAWLILHASTSAPDTDFAAVLTDVQPDGRAILISLGILRAAFRDSLESPTPVIPGRPYEFTIELNEFAHVFMPGHRLELIVSSCLFPNFAPNPNTGEPYGSETGRMPATQTVLHGGEHPSYLLVHQRHG